MMHEDHRMILDELVSRLESDLITLSSHERAGDIKGAVEAWSKENPGIVAPKEVGWEICALDMIPQRRHSGTATIDRRFGPLIEVDGHGYPDVEALMADNGAIAYYKQRAEDTANPIQQARYADILWEALRACGAEDAFRYGELAVEAYLKLAQLCLSTESVSGQTPIRRGIELADSLARASEIAQQLNNRDLAAEVVAGVRNALSDLAGDELYRWVIDLGHILLRYWDSRLGDLVPPDLFDEMRSICTEGISYHDAQEQRNLNILDDLMRLGRDISKVMGDDAESWRFQVEMAESWEKEARFRESGGGAGRGSLVAFKYTEGALREYQHLASLAPTDADRARIRQKVTDLKVEVRRLSKQAEGEMKEIIVSADIESERLEQMVQPFLACDMCGVFELLPSLLPNVDQLRDAATEAAEKYVFSSLLPRITLRSGRKVDEVDAFQGESVQFQQQLDIWFQLHAQFLDYILMRLEEAGVFTCEGYLACVQLWPLLEERDVPFIERGLERYFAEDYMSAIHVLAPRIESMLKAVCERAGIPSVVLPDARRIREQGLGDFLVRQEVRTGLGEGMWRYINYALVDEHGGNLRNEVAHGWIDAANCSRVVAKILLFIIALLTRLELADSSRESSDVGAT